MSLIIAIAIGVLFGSGVWLILRPRSFQVLTGLMLMSYAVNLFIFVVSGVRTGAPPLVPADGMPDLSSYGDPIPQALVLTAIVIGFATTALYLVILIGSRGLTGTDHVDGKESEG